jgi:hypothetical protein
MILKILSQKNLAEILPIFSKKGRFSQEPML